MPFALERRDFLRLGALTLSGYGLLPWVRPLPARAGARVTPRGSARSVIFLNLQGGPSQMDTFDVKEGKWAPENRGVRLVPQGYRFPVGLFPKLTGQLGHLAVVRSMEAWDTVHSRAQYYLQTGHALSPARLEEAPSLGAIIAYETAAQRQSTDFLPAFTAINYEATTMNSPLVREGCLPASMSPLTFDLKDGSLPFLMPEAEKERFARRWSFLQSFDASRQGLDAGAPRTMRQFASFAESARQMMSHPRIAEVVRLDPAARQAYGATALGDACLMARQMVAARAGARFIFITQPGWDHHGNIYGKDGKGGIYPLCRDLDQAMAALVEDLARPGADGRRLLDDTLIVCMGEFGRTPGELTVMDGREHWDKAMFGVFAGAGVKGGRVIGATDEQAGRVTDPGWSASRSIYPEDVCATIYSALGIDWTKRLTGTPSGRDFIYVDPAAGSKVINFREIGELYA